MLQVRLDAFLEIGQRSANPCLQHDVGVSDLRPDDNGRTVIGAFEARAFVPGRLHHPLFVGLLVVERALGQELGLAERNLAELDGAVVEPLPVVDVLARLRHLDGLEVLSAALRLTLICVVVTPTPP